MASLPDPGASDPTTDKHELELVDRVADGFWLPRERVIHAGLGQHEATGELYGRGEGEGRLYLTTHRFIFWFEKPRGAEFIGIPKEHIENVKSGRIPVPGMRVLSLKMDAPARGLTDNRSRARFYVGVPLAGVAERDWRLSTSPRPPGPGVEYPEGTGVEGERRSEVPAGSGRAGLVYAFGAACNECGHRWRTEVTPEEASRWADIAARSEPTWEYRYESQCPNCAAHYSNAFDMDGLLSTPPQDHPMSTTKAETSTTITFDHGVDALICDRCQTDNRIAASHCRGCDRPIDWVISAVARMAASQFGYVAPDPADPIGHPASRD
jgi:hypothetical protein